MMSKNRHALSIAMIVLALTLPSCGSQLVLVAPTPTGPGPVAVATSATVPPAATTAGCTLGASFVADVSVPNGTVFSPNTAFQKTWRVKNSGTCDWNAGTQLVYVSGDPLSGPVAVAGPVVAAGSMADVSVNLVSPGSAGTYMSSWQMQSPDGMNFGDMLSVQIVVAGATAVPTFTPLISTNTPQPTNEPPSPTNEPPSPTDEPPAPTDEPPPPTNTLPPPTNTPPPPTDTPPPTSTPTSTPKPDWPVFRVGMEGPGVYAIQYLLRSNGFILTADGKYGNKTMLAVKAFQESKGLSADGIVGPNTWPVLTEGHMVRQGSSGEDVKAVQHLLHYAYGFSNVTVDGAFGEKTDLAVRKFQDTYHLIVDGIVGGKTWKTLIQNLP